LPAAGSAAGANWNTKEASLLIYKAPSPARVAGIKKRKQCPWTPVSFSMIAKAVGCCCVRKRATAACIARMDPSRARRSRRRGKAEHQRADARGVGTTEVGKRETNVREFAPGFIKAGIWLPPAPSCPPSPGVNVGAQLAVGFPQGARMRTADYMVGGFHYLSDRHEVGSLLGARTKRLEVLRKTLCFKPTAIHFRATGEKVVSAQSAPRIFRGSKVRR
jgi:hypothetical protein